MRLSQYFLPVLKETPQEATIISHQYMLRSGMVRQLNSGIYSWLPLGLKVLRNIEAIVREELERDGVVELLMPTIQPAELWEESGRYDAYGKEMLRIKDRHDREMLYGPTNEEAIVDIMRASLRSYKDLPKQLYQIQWKFRDEIRPRFGVMRGREFLMKDAYSFDLTHEDAVKSYNLYYEAYLRLFKRLGLTAIPVRAVTGAIGGDLSHEFQVLAETGESEIFYDQTFDELRDGSLSLSTEEMRKLYAAADEQHVPEQCPVEESRLKSARGIEVGHIFNFGTKYSEPMGFKVVDKNNQEIPVQMGSYGVGVSRLVGAIIESSHDDKGIIWPETVAPFDLGVVNLKPGHEACEAMVARVEEQLGNMGKEMLIDDTDARAGAKFATMELIGLPWMLTIGPRGAEQGMVELTHRHTGEKQELALDAAMQRLNAPLAKAA